METITDYCRYTRLGGEGGMFLFLVIRQASIAPAHQYDVKK
jgi:hypothetical protein